jgi:plastocyanin domain-containing protein
VHTNKVDYATAHGMNELHGVAQVKYRLASCEGAFVPV